MTERILVTGGAGFIGSHLVDRLIADGETVTVLDDFSAGHERNLAHLRGNDRLAVVRGSILDEALVERTVAEHPVVYHLAAVAGVRNVVVDPLRGLLTNVRGTENVLASAHRSRSRVVLASSSEVYGRSTQLPFREDGERVLGPTWIHRWSYSTSKAVDEHLAFAFAERGLVVRIVRYFNSYGPRLDERGYGSVVARFAMQALRGEPLTVHGTGTQTRTFTYVTDTVEGTVRAGRHPSADGQAFNIGSTEEVTIADLAKVVRDIAGSSSPIVLVPYETAFPSGFEDTLRRVPDVTKAERELGFRARTTMADGLRSTMAWFRDTFGARIPA